MIEARPTPALEPITLRYEGGDAEQHEIDLNQLGASLQGFARVLAVCSHLAYTGRYNKQFDALSVKVYAAPAPEHHCYEVLAHIKDIALSKELWSGFGGVLLTLLVQYVFSRRSEEEMKHLSEALKQSMGQNAAMVERLLGTVEKMADALQPAARQALTPVGDTCKSIGIYSGAAERPSVVLDEQTKERMKARTVNSIEPARAYLALISEMDMQTGTCRVSLDEEAGSARIPAVITDPLGFIPGNAYAVAMAQAQPIRFLAKAELNPNGEIVKLYISDLAPEDPA